MATIPNYYAVYTAQNSQFSAAFIFENDDGSLMDLTGKTFEFAVRPQPVDFSPTPSIKVSSTGATSQGYITVNLATATVLVVTSPTANAVSGGQFTLWMDPGQADATAMVQGPYVTQPTAAP